MKDFINNEIIEGYVFDIGNNFNELQERITGEQSKSPGTKYISGDLNIAVDEEGLNVVTVHYNYVTEKTKKDKVNNTYKILKTIIDDPKTWINVGKENCYKVRCSRVSLAVNDFIAKDGTKVAALRNENGFISFVNTFNKDEKMRHRFEIDMYINNVKRIEANPEKDIDKDFVSVSGCAFGYGSQIPTLFPVSLVIKEPDGMKYFEDLDISPSQPVFTKVWGVINSMTKTVTRTEDSAFGAPAVKTYSKVVKEYEITGTSRVPYDFGDEEVLTLEDINKMNQNRQIKLAEIEAQTEERKKQSTQPTFNIPDEDFDF